MAVETGHFQITEFSKETIPQINWMMEDLFCQYGVAMPYFLLDFAFPDYFERPEWMTYTPPDWYLPEWKAYWPTYLNQWPNWIEGTSFDFNLDWGEWGYLLPWFNELLGLLFDEAGLPREMLTDLSPTSMTFLNDQISTLYQSVTAFAVTQRTTTASDKETPQIQVVDDTIYFMWSELDSLNHYQIWTATMNTDGTSFTPTKQTSGVKHSLKGKFEVVGTTIYYVYVYDGDTIYTATTDLDGSSWSAALQRSVGAVHSIAMQVSGTKIYYAWSEFDAGYFIWTGNMDTDGSSWVATKHTSTLIYNYSPQLDISGSTIYYVYYGRDADKKWNIFIATSDLDGSGWSTTQKTTEERSQGYPQLQVVDDIIYYCWEGQDAAYDYYLWTATMGTDGSGWSHTMQSGILRDPQQKVVSADSKIYYIGLDETVAASRHVMTAKMNMNGTGFTATERTDKAYDLESPEIDVSEGAKYYVWLEADADGDDQIWTAKLT